MIRYVCASQDRAAGLFGQPFMVPAIGAAVRSFTDEVNRSAEGNVLFAHPEDFELWLLAEFDDATGIYAVPDGGARVLARGKDVKLEKGV